MAKECYLCGKKSIIRGSRKKLRGKYNPTGKFSKSPNLQWMKLPSGGRAKVCVQCLRTQTKI